jgi:hypothetical protein
MLVLNQFSGVSAATGLAGFETTPEVFFTRKQVNPRTPPAALFCVFVTFEDVVAHSTIVPSRECICIQ